MWSVGVAIGMRLIYQTGAGTCGTASRQIQYGTWTEKINFREVYERVEPFNFLTWCFLG